jgi:hypothetical protein
MVHMQTDAHRSLLWSFESSSAIVAFLHSLRFSCGVQNSLPFSCTILATLSLLCRKKQRKYQPLLLRDTRAGMRILGSLALCHQMAHLIPPGGLLE